MAVLASSAMTLILAAFLVGWMSKFAAATGPATPDRPHPTAAEMKDHLLWGLFYVHPDDPRGWVPKTSGFGYTVNFRTGRSARIYAGLIVATMVSAGVLIGLVVRGG